MTDLATLDAYGTVTEPTTLRIQRLLPGPAERVWAYLVESDLRRQWLASGAMAESVGAPVDLVWRNDELTDPPGRRPSNFSTDHSMRVEVTECDPPHRLAITWGSTGGVSFDLEPQGGNVLLTLVHHRVLDRSVLLNVSAGWHAHLDVLAARLAGRDPEPFWDAWMGLKADYEGRLSA
ncbi:SRPBCC family protein [Microvirga pudoricolor]|uniref:SRPBCC family protein n=1 Tax=Microvirga pudoricolor TaxID=2778729 RepID=UPI001951F6C6|nr:SRPBCC family protein [Microvirga pudoricolor]MBM6593358.1 SRPBCC family protein [Microvirga pudoricolor]